MKFFIYALIICNISIAAPVDRIVAIVNKDIILKSDLKELKENIKKGVLFDSEYGSLFDLKSLKENEKTQIDYLIGEQLFMDHANKTGIYSKSKSQLDSEIEKIAKSNGLTNEEFKKEIISQGVSFEDYKKFILKSLVRKRIIDSEITSRIEISESDIIQYLMQQGSKSFEPRYLYSISHIVIGDEENLKRVSNIIRTEGFEQALRYSENQENKGFLGAFKDDELAKPFKTTVKELKISEVSQPISMNGKIFFIRLDDKKRINELPDTPEVRKAKMTIIQENISTEVQAWIEEKRQTNHVIIKEG